MSLLSFLTRFEQKVDSIMATLQDILAAEQAEGQKITALVALVTQLHTELVAALASGDMTTIAQIVSDLGTQTAAVTGAIAANPDPEAAPPSTSGTSASGGTVSTPGTVAS